MKKVPAPLKAMARAAKTVEMVDTLAEGNGPPVNGKELLVDSGYYTEADLNGWPILFKGKNSISAHLGKAGFRLAQNSIGLWALMKIFRRRLRAVCCRRPWYLT